MAFNGAHLCALDNSEATHWNKCECPLAKTETQSCTPCSLGSTAGVPMTMVRFLLCEI